MLGRHPEEEIRYYLEQPLWQLKAQVVANVSFFSLPPRLFNEFLDAARFGQLPSRQTRHIIDLAFKLWFGIVEEPLHEAICINGNYCEKRRDERFNDHVTIISGLADILANQMGLGVSPTLVAVTMFKMQLDIFCLCTPANYQFHCAGMTRAGSQCKRVVGHEGAYCYQHLEQR
jgi:hypothetical protein